MCCDAMMETEYILDIRDLVAQYGDVRVLHDINLKIRKGEIFVVIGGSGCGKTTLLKHMTGLIRPVSGSVWFEGKDITRMNEDELALVQRNIGIQCRSSSSHC